MEILFAGSERSPKVTFDNPKLVISGRSFMDNSVDFYRNLIAAIRNLKAASLQVVMNLEYFNTSSSKCLLELFRTFEKMQAEGTNVEVQWTYEASNSDLAEAGEDYLDLVRNIKFELVEL